MTYMYTENSNDTNDIYTRGFFSIQVSWFPTKTQTYKKKEAILKSNLVLDRV